MFNRNKKTSASLPGVNNQSTVGSAANTNAILQELAVDYMRDKKIKRRWKIALFILFAIYLIGILAMTSGKQSVSVAEPHTAIVELNGIIGTEMGVSAEQINSSLRKAFEAKNSKGVILQINSPGGSPVQSADINTEITRLRAAYPNKPMHVVMADVAASGGYFVAVAGDKIYANRSSIVGSIGVRMDSFGFVDALKKYGVERRSITAGNNKAILDPFLPMKASQKAHAEKMLNEVHQHFIEVVKQGRGEKLIDNPDIFSGLFWSGQEAKELGLIDGFGNVSSVARDVIGHEKLVNYTFRPNFLDEFSRQFGVAVGQGIGHVLGGGLILK